ncbi:MAG: cytochrome c biogenesis protein ResB [Deltaproteobacteria bacterium]|nr:cytochrome c biogenesis protein ResB [Deltaproteobacteria bacterium]
MTTSRPRAGGAVWGFFASVKLAIVLLIILAATAVIGTLLPQGKAAPFYLQHYPVPFAKIILAFQLDSLYSSFWFVGLLLALGANLVVCSLNRLPKVLKKIFTVPRPAELRLPNLKLKAEIISPLPPQAAVTKAAQELGRLGRVVQGGGDNNSEATGQTIFFVQSGRFTRLGAYVIHLSILTFFAAGLTTAIWGFKGFVNIYEGQSADSIVLRRGRVMDLDFQIRLDKFIFETYPGGAPKTYQSNLSFLKNGQVAGQAQVLVNRPATFDRLTFYQASYGQGLGRWLDLVVTFADGTERAVRLKAQGHEHVPGLGLLEIVDFSPNLKGIGPGARLSLTKPEASEAEVFWVISRPPYQMRQGAPEQIRMTGFDGRYYTGLQANYDPGVGFVWIGGILMLLGLGVTFFGNHRRYWLEISPCPEGSRIRLAGKTNRNQPAFERRFQVLFRRLGDLLGEASQGEER